MNTSKRKIPSTNIQIESSNKRRKDKPIDPCLLVCRPCARIPRRRRKGLPPKRNGKMYCSLIECSHLTEPDCCAVCDKEVCDTCLYLIGEPWSSDDDEGDDADDDDASDDDDEFAPKHIQFECESQDEAPILPQAEVPILPQAEVPIPNPMPDTSDQRRIWYLNGIRQILTQTLTRIHGLLDDITEIVDGYVINDPCDDCIQAIHDPEFVSEREVMRSPDCSCYEGEESGTCVCYCRCCQWTPCCICNNCKYCFLQYDEHLDQHTDTDTL